MSEQDKDWTPCIKLPVIVHVRKQREGETHVSTREGITPVKPDDLIMRGVSGEEYPIGREIFEKTYTLDVAVPVEHTICLNPIHNETICSKNQDFYTHNTQPKEWVGLTDEEIETIRTTGNIWTAYDIAKAVEAKLREKNT